MRGRLCALFSEFVEYGGFPEIVLAKETLRRKLLTDYFSDILEKDVGERHGIRKKQKLYGLASYYMSNPCAKVSFNRLSASLSIPPATVERYSRYIEEAYLIFFLKRFSFKVKEQENSARKVYAADTGLSNAMGFKSGENKGKVFENAAYLEILKANANRPGFEIFYWQDYREREVDFVVRQEGKVTALIQACIQLSGENSKREFTPLALASKELACKNLIVLTEDREGETEFRGSKIRITPLWKWLIINGKESGGGALPKSSRR